jgi:hypothetical protein
MKVSPSPGIWLIVFGLVLAGIGATWVFAPKLWSWFGYLPGDIRVVREGFRLQVPLVSMLLVSIGLTLLIRLVAWLMESR